jgi:hypothetical protein
MDEPTLEWRASQMKRTFPLITVFLLLTTAIWSQEIKRPVFFLRYEGGIGTEELDTEEWEEAALTLDTYRHKITLRIKEQWRRDFTTNLYTAVAWKDYRFQEGDYTYFYLNPNFIWDISDRLRWRSEVRSKWTWFTDPSDPKEVGLTSLLAKTELTAKVSDKLKIIPSLRSEFDLYLDSTGNRQTYTGGLRLEANIKPEVRLSSRYRGTLRAPLGGSDEILSINHEFGLNLTWDPNK